MRVVELGRHVEGHLHRRDRCFGMRADGACRRRHHAAAQPCLRAGAGRDHLTDELHAERVGEGRVDREVAAVAAVDLVVVADRCRGADQDLAGRRSGSGDLVELECLARAPVADHAPRADRVTDAHGAPFVIVHCIPLGVSVHGRAPVQRMTAGIPGSHLVGRYCCGRSATKRRHSVVASGRGRSRRCRSSVTTGVRSHRRSNR